MATSVIKKNALSARFQPAYRQRSNGTLAPILAFGDDVSTPIGLTHMPANGQAYADIGGGNFVPFAEAVFGSNLTPITKTLTQRLRQAYKALPGGALAPVLVFGSDASNPIAIPSLSIAKRTVQPYVEVASGIFAPYAIAVVNEGATVVERDLGEEGKFNLAYKALAGGVLAPIVVFGTNTASPVTRGNKVEDQRQAFVQLSPGLYAPFFALFQDNPVEILTPVNTALPAITGTLKVGETINLGNGTWTNSPTSYARKLHHVGQTASLATGTTYVVQAGDLGKSFELDVVATNAQGDSPVATSLPSAVVVAADVVVPADARPRWFNAPATGFDAANKLDTATVIPGSTNGDSSGTATVTTTTGNFGWLAIKADQVPSGIHISNATDGAGGWSGAGEPANWGGASPDPAIKKVLATSTGGVEFALFRMDYLNSAPTAKPFVFSAA